MAKKNKKTDNKIETQKVVVKTVEENRERVSPTVSRVHGKPANTVQKGEVKMLFEKENYMWLAIGAGLMVVGLALMSGGHQAPNEWNADEIYSFRRIGLAPMVMLAGLGATLYAIFKKAKTA